MAIRSPTSRPIILTPALPSAAQRVHYQRALQDLILEMARDFMATLSGSSTSPGLAMDAHNFSDLARLFEQLNKKWMRVWFEKAPGIAAASVNGMSAHADRQFQAALERSGFAVSFRPTPHLANKINFAAQYNTSLIKSIGSEYLDQVGALVAQAALKGGDSFHLAKELRARYGVTKSRAELIARDQNAKISAVVTNDRRAECGLFFARWHHGAGLRNPRPSHLEAGLKGLIFDIRKGAYLDKKWVQPAEEINCHCSSRTIIPALDKVDPVSLMRDQVL